jgi:hypothetical protein
LELPQPTPTNRLACNDPGWIAFNDNRFPG